MAQRYLKITRNRTFRSYLDKLVKYGMYRGFPNTEVDSLRWNRLGLCICSVEEYLVSTLQMRFVEV